MKKPRGWSGRRETTPAERARECARVTQRQRAQQAKGRCRSCGDRIAAGSTSRCPSCLEQCRRYERQRRGITTAGERRRGRPMIGTLGERRRAFAREEARRERCRLRQEDRLPFPPVPRSTRAQKRWFERAIREGRVSPSLPPTSEPVAAVPPRLGPIAVGPLQFVGDRDRSLTHRERIQRPATEAPAPLSYDYPRWVLDSQRPSDAARTGRARPSDISLLSRLRRPTR